MGWLVSELAEDFRYAWIAALPVSELRVAIPLAVHQGVHPLKAFVLGVLGNSLPVGPILFVFRPLTVWLHRRPTFRRAVEWLWKHNLRKSRSVRTYGLIGLAVFVAVPLPGTGAWTAAIIAALLRMPFKASAAAILSGVVAAGVIVTLLTVLVSPQM